MAKSVRTSPTSGRMSSIVSGDRSRVTRTPSTVYAQSPLYNPELGMPSTRTTFGTAPGKTNRQKAMPAPTGVAQVTPPKNVPRTYASKPSILSMLAPTKVITKKPAAPVKKPPVQVISNVVREKMTPVKAAPPARAKPPATRFGVVTGTTTGTKTGGGGGYGGGGTRGGGSLSGGGSGSRSAGTSRTGGTQRNDPVRG